MHDLHNRRTFLRAIAAAGAGWAAADLSQIDAALVWAAQQNASSAASIVALTRGQADVVTAAAARILPAVGGRPGAREAGVVYFIDKALSTFNAGQKAIYVEGIDDLNSRAAQRRAGAGFIGLDLTEQDGVLRAIENTAFFAALRVDTIVGTFALPSWGGNRDFSGWHLIGLDHQPRFQPPFGYYDAGVNSGR
jgi:gluconate 2-dehydrogenase gamma chain